MSVSTRKELKTMKDITKEQVNEIAPVVKARVNARLDEFKKNDPVAWWSLTERDYIELVKTFHKEELDKHVAEVMGW